MSLGFLVQGISQEILEIGDFRIKRLGYAPIITCPASEHANHFHLPERIIKNQNKNSVELATFNVTFLQAPPEAQTAFSEAIRILEQVIPSEVPINVAVQFTEQGPGTLASAGPTDLIVITGGGLPPNTFYPIALAEKLIAEDINEPSEFDIVVSVNDAVDWYYDFNNPGDIGNSFDFVTVILHELLHGLGFRSSTDVTANNGIISFGGLVDTYDRNLETGDGLSLADDIQDPVELGRALRGGDIFYGSRFFEINSPTDLPEMNAPSVFSGASSIGHFDGPSVFNTADALMAPNINNGTTIRDLGASLDVLYDIGWNQTSIFINHEFFTEDVNEDAEFIVEVISDFPFDTSELNLFYFQGNFNFLNLESIPLEYTGQGNFFRASVEAPGEESSINFYYSTRDNRNLTTSNPSNAPQAFFVFNWGMDRIAPMISHDPISSISEVDDSIFFEIRIIDEFTGVDTAFIDIEIPGKFNQTFGLERGLNDFNDIVYRLDFDIPVAISEADIIRYRFSASDNASAANTGVLPESGFFEIGVEAIPEPLRSYVNDFNSPSDDFSGVGFSIRLEDGFDDEAIHSDHDYGQAADRGLTDFELTYQLNRPIIVSADNATVAFDEVALLEPGELGVPFPQAEFWDYVVVEGKKLSESRWTAIAPGYDARADAEWLSVYNSDFESCPELSTFANCISLGAGTKELYRERILNITDNPAFVAGDTIQFRFRLFSDPLITGWGWAIDNLSIQTEKITTDVVEVQNVDELLIGPNPVSNELVVDMRFSAPKEKVDISIIDYQGRVLKNQFFDSSNTEISVNFDMTSLADGLYLLQIKEGQFVTTRHIAKVSE